jgi:hypothetical protein
MADVDISDILLSIAKAVSESLEAMAFTSGLGTLLSYSTTSRLFADSHRSIGEAELSVGIAKLPLKLRKAPNCATSSDST